MTDSPVAPAAPRARPWRAAWVRPAGCTLVCAAASAATLLSDGTAAGLAAGLAVLACLAAGWPAPGAAAPARAAASPAPDDDAFGMQGARLMVAEVVPVWKRQMESAREIADRGFQDMATNFAGLVGELDQLDRPGASPALPDDGVAGLLARHPEALDDLLVPLRAAARQRASVLQALGETATPVHGLKRLGRDMKAFARHTRLVAMNAAIEAQRAAPEMRAGLAAVAAEVRSLGDEAARMGGELAAHVADIDTRVQPLRGDAASGSPGDDELQMQAQLAAQRAVTCLLAGLGDALATARQNQSAASDLRQRVEELLLGFQVGDRVNQMLDILAADLSRLVEWNATQVDARPADAQAWLAALAERYTTDEQRREHHGTVAIQRHSEVEFF